MQGPGLSTHPAALDVRRIEGSEAHRHR